MEVQEQRVRPSTGLLITKSNCISVSALGETLGLGFSWAWSGVGCSCSPDRRCCSAAACGMCDATASAGRDSALLRVRGSGLQVGGVNVGGALMREMPGPSHSYLSVHRVAVCI